MQIDEAQYARITNPRIRQRTLTLPVRRGEWKELKKCPVKRGGVYELAAATPYFAHMETAEAEPTRALAVIALIDLCSQPGKKLKITVLDVSREGELWTVRFEKGANIDQFDTDLYLSRENDFTTSPSRQTVKGDPPYTPPFAADLKRARDKAREKRDEPNRSTVAALRTAHRKAAMRNHELTVEAQRQLQRIEKAIDRFEGMLPGASGGTLTASVCAQGPEARELNADTEPSTESDVSLQPGCLKAFS